MYNYFLCLFNLFKLIIKNKLPQLLKNNQYNEALNNILKNEYNYYEFIIKNIKEDNLNINKTTLKQLISLLISKNKKKLLLYLNNFDKVFNLFIMVLHENSFYSINNPLNIDPSLLKDNILIKKTNIMLNEYKKLLSTGLKFDQTQVINFRTGILSIIDIIKPEFTIK